MPDASGLADFKQGVSLLCHDHPSEAVKYFRRAAKLDQQNPIYMSYLGVSMARAKGNWAAALELCKTALNLRGNEAQLYMNLADVYLSSGQRDIAVETLDSGLRNCRADARIAWMRGKLENRRSPILPFLERGHFLNRSLGKLRHQVSKRSRKSEKDRLSKPEKEPFSPVYNRRWRSTTAKSVS